MNRQIVIKGFVNALALVVVVQLAGACSSHAASSGGTRGRSQTAFASGAGAQAAVEPQKDFRWSGRLAAGRTLEVKGVNGGIEAEPSSGGEIEVVAEKSARRSDASSVRVEVVEHAEGVTICAVYPSSDPAKPNTCAPGGGGRMNVRDNDTQVSFKVRVPAGVRFTAHTVNGDVQAERLGADVEAMTVNGSVKVSTTGLARARTVNGSINAAMGSAEWSDELEFHTVNGGIELSFPASLSAVVEAETLNGDIQSDFPMTVTGRFSKRHLSGTIGGGGRELNLKTVNGSVLIRRAS
jgi:hypothetical protein